MERDEVDVGVASVPAGPWGCPFCWYVEAVAVIGGGTWPPEWLGW